ncbi:MAG: hypothetical protein U5N86_04630 [Planctomycetota bacterium]|nr:hypothetical protein [Planctomycetota bacterium]
MAWRFKATLTDGTTVADGLSATGRSDWLELADKLSRDGGAICTLVLSDGEREIVLPASGRYVHLKKAFCEITGGAPTHFSYAVGFVTGREAVLVWGEEDGSVRIERRPLCATLERYGIDGVSSQ